MAWMRRVQSPSALTPTRIARSAPIELTVKGMKFAATPERRPGEEGDQNELPGRLRQSALPAA
jgi:hypothetical protein